MNRELRTCIDRADYISFDLFDTLILRRVMRPTDLFAWVQEVFQSTRSPLTFDFQSSRVEAERRARERAWAESKRHEITFDEIYRLLQAMHALESEVIAGLMAVEIALEQAACLRNPSAYDAYRYAVAQGKGVVFTSDMYLPEEVIRQILANAGYADEHRLFLSATHGITKSSGHLYDLLISEIGVAPGQVLHIGDNLQSDIEMAAAKGLATYHYAKCLDLAHAVGFSPLDLLAEPSREEALFRSLYSGLQINHQFAPREAVTPLQEDAFWRHLGYRRVGVLFLGFIEWLIADLRHYQPDRVYFLARDGHVMRQVYELLRDYHPDLPPSDYLYASRRALNFPAATQMDDATLDFLMSGTSLMSVKQYLARIGLAADAFKSEIQGAGFSGPEQLVDTPQAAGQLRNLFLVLGEQVLDLAAEERKVLLEYLASVGFVSGRRVAVVDIGWHGSLQKSLASLLAADGQDVRLKGYYLGTFSRAREYVEKGLDMVAYLCEYGQPEDYHDIIKLCVEIFEFVHSAPHGSVIRIQKREGNFVPQLEDDSYEREKLRKAALVQEGALDFIRDFMAVRALVLSTSLPKDLALSPLHQLLRDPTVEEAVKLGDLVHVEGFGGSYAVRYIAKAPGFWQALISPSKVEEEYARAFWKSGYLRRIPTLPLLGRPLWRGPQA